ncbi:MAG: pilus assembly protein [Lachnospiraceae bacterium]|nr:pilus assembly protein [Lachnospiraceae bacterium]
MNQKRNTRGQVKASMTIAASFALPLFIFATLCLVYLLEIHAISFSLRAATMSAAKDAAVETTLTEMVIPMRLKRKIINLVGRERMERSIIQNGANGIRVIRTRYDSEREEIDVVVTYKLRLPLPGFTNISVNQKEAFRVKAWTGYKSPGDSDEDGSIVYVAERGRVYHENYGCTYLQLSIQFVGASGVSDFRNENGGKYYSCERCVYGGSMAGVYITNQGNRYHNSLNCGGLKRTIRAVQRNQVNGLGGCSRCS